MVPELMQVLVFAVGVPGGRQSVVELLAQRMPLVYMAVAVTVSVAVTLFGLYLVIVKSLARERYAAMVEEAPAADRQALVDAAYAQHGNDTLWRQMLWQLVEQHELHPVAQEDDQISDEVCAVAEEPLAAGSTTLECVKARDNWIKENPGKLPLAPEHAEPPAHKQ